MPKLKDLVPKPKTRVAFIIDRSGSMGGMEKFVIDTHNEQLQELLKNKDSQEITVTTVLFDGTVEFVMVNSPIVEAKELTTETYRPGGSTALNDAIGMTIDKFKRLGDEKDDDVSYLFIIVTDGHENASREYKSSYIKDYVNELQASNKWTFTFFGEEGRGINLQNVSQQYGFKMNNMSLGSLKDGDDSFMLRSIMGTKHFMRSREAGITSMQDYYKPVSEGITLSVDLSSNSEETEKA